MSDHKGARLLLPGLPRARELLADRGYDSDRFRARFAEGSVRRSRMEWQSEGELAKCGTTPCIPPTRNRKLQLPYDKTLYRQRHRIENAFGRIKDWRRVAPRYDRCAHTFFSAICIAATVIFWMM